MDLEAINKYRYINTSEELVKIIENLEKHRSLAVDLEADSMFHFKEKVCLIQLATKKENLIIDPLVIKDISPLKPIFENPKIRKVFHGADYDIRSLHRDFNFEVKNLFDTELACRYLGESHTGLGAILNKRFNIKLNKKYQKKDWSQRPLPDGMLEYGVNDVTFLIQLCEELERDLKDKGRISWIKEECEILSMVRINTNCKEHLFMNIKGAGKLGSRSLSVLEALCEFRIKHAALKDKPLFKIISNESLIKLAQRRPVSKTQLKKIQVLSAKQHSMFGDEIVEVIETAMKIPSKDLPRYPKKKPPSVNPEVPSRIRKLKTWREKTSKYLDLDPSLILNKSLMYKIASVNPMNLKRLSEIEFIRKWQINEFGSEIIKVLKSGKKNGKQN